MGLDQVPEGFIATPVLQDALVHLVDLMESATHAGTFLVAPAVSRAGEVAQTSATHTPEQMAP